MPQLLPNVKDQTPQDTGSMKLVYYFSRREIVQGKKLALGKNVILLGPLDGAIS